MADEQIGIEIEIKGSQKTLKSVKDLKDAVKELEKTASEADYGSDEYLKATKSAEDLKKKMAELSGDASKKLGQSLNDLKRQYKELKVALSEASDPHEFKRLSAELNDVEGKIGDMNDAASLAVGSGVEQLQKSIGLVGEGLRNFDFEKVKIGFKGIGNAMSAAAPLLLVAAIGALIENFDKVKEVIVQIIPALDSTSKATHQLERENKKLVETNKIVITSLENELRILEVSGASQAQILAKKKELIAVKIKELESDNALQKSRIVDIEQNDSLLESSNRLIVNLYRKTGLTKEAEALEKAIALQKYSREKEFTDKIRENEISISKLKTDLVVDQINNDKKVADSANKNFNDAEKRRQEELKKIGEANKAKEEAIKQFSTNSRNLLAEEQAADTAAKKKKADEDLKIEIAKFDEEQRLKKENEEKKKKLDEETAKAKAQLEKESFNAAKNLSDAVFAIQIGNAKKGSAEETKLKKQQFQINKAFAVTQATIDGIRAVQTVLATYPLPLSIPIAAATGVSSAANIAKIASAKFEGGASSGSVSAPSVGSGSTNLPTPPTIQQSNTTTQFDNQGNNLGQSNQRQVIDITGKVSVSQNDIEEKQKRADRLKVQTTF